ncbi:MAG: hypothetical protein P1U36_09250 [Legionellaceae bacterium]|nr:hypothetical protein [Legionellaceae bacterium]
MDSNIGLTTKYPEQSPPCYAHLSFFSTNTSTTSFDNRLALVHKIGRFIEEAIETCYFEYWLNDVSDTPFCSEKTQKPTVYVAPFLLRMIEIMDKECAVENILIYMIIYIDRYFNLHKDDYLHRSNFKLLIICGAWLAIKKLEDIPSNKYDFEQLVALSGMNKDQLKDLELFFLSELGWQAHIVKPIYDNFCNALKDYQPELNFQEIDEGNDEIEDGLRGLAFV